MANLGSALSAACLLLLPRVAAGAPGLRGSDPAAPAPPRRAFERPDVLDDGTIRPLADHFSGSCLHAQVWSGSGGGRHWDHPVFLDYCGDVDHHTGDDRLRDYKTWRWMGDRTIRPLDDLSLCLSVGHEGQIQDDEYSHDLHGDHYNLFVRGCEHEPFGDHPPIHEDHPEALLARSSARASQSFRWWPEDSTIRMARFSGRCVTIQHFDIRVQRCELPVPQNVDPHHHPQHGEHHDEGARFAIGSMVECLGDRDDFQGRNIYSPDTHGYNGYHGDGPLGFLFYHGTVGYDGDHGSDVGSGGLACATYADVDETQHHHFEGGQDRQHCSLHVDPRSRLFAFEVCSECGFCVRPTTTTTGTATETSATATATSETTATATTGTRTATETSATATATSETTTTATTGTATSETTTTATTGTETTRTGELAAAQTAQPTAETTSDVGVP